MSKREVERDYLTENELQEITNKSFPTERLSLVRDIFLFSCFTGLAYADVDNFPKVTDVLYSGIMATTAFRFKPELIIANKFIIQFFDVYVVNSVFPLYKGFRMISGCVVPFQGSRGIFFT